jgi:hypothetical protein
MKKSAAFLILFLFALLAWNVFAWTWGGDTTFNIDGDEVDGPLAALLGLVFAGGGTLLAAGIMLLVGGILAVVFAGVGIVIMGALALAAFAVALAVAPLLLPLLLPLAVIWYFASRSRKTRAVHV